VFDWPQHKHKTKQMSSAKPNSLAWLRSRGLDAFVQEMLNEVARVKPDKPFAFMVCEIFDRLSALV
jgi:hypothetical protein